MGLNFCHHRKSVFLFVCCLFGGLTQLCWGIRGTYAILEFEPKLVTVFMLSMCFTFCTSSSVHHNTSIPKLGRSIQKLTWDHNKQWLANVKRVSLKWVKKRDTLCKQWKKTPFQENYLWLGKTAWVKNYNLKSRRGYTDNRHPKPIII